MSAIPTTDQHDTIAPKFGFRFVGSALLIAVACGLLMHAPADMRWAGATAFAIGILQPGTGLLALALVAPFLFLSTGDVTGFFQAFVLGMMAGETRLIADRASLPPGSFRAGRRVGAAPWGAALVIIAILFGTIAPSQSPSLIGVLLVAFVAARRATFLHVLRFLKFLAGSTALAGIFLALGAPGVTGGGDIVRAPETLTRSQELLVLWTALLLVLGLAWEACGAWQNWNRNERRIIAVLFGVLVAAMGVAAIGGFGIPAPGVAIVSVMGGMILGTARRAQTRPLKLPPRAQIVAILVALVLAAMYLTLQARVANP